MHIQCTYIVFKTYSKGKYIDQYMESKLGPHSIRFYCVTLYVRRTLTGNYIYMYIQIKSNTFIDIVNALIAVEIRLCNILTVD